MEREKVKINWCHLRLVRPNPVSGLNSHCNATQLSQPGVCTLLWTWQAGPVPADTPNGTRTYPPVATSDSVQEACIQVEGFAIQFPSVPGLRQKVVSTGSGLLINNPSPTKVVYPPVFPKDSMPCAEPDSSLEPHLLMSRYLMVSTLS